MGAKIGGRFGALAAAETIYLYSYLGVPGILRYAPELCSYNGCSYNVDRTSSYSYSCSEQHERISRKKAMAC
jgi:hypothetical protein